MTPRTYQGVVVDLCSGCGSVYLDEGEAEATGIDSTLLGKEASPAGASSKTCPCGKAKMTRFSVALGNGQMIEIDRSSCCGGVFLDASEHGRLVKRTAAMVKKSEQMGSKNQCPRCQGPFYVASDKGIEIDTCGNCQALFLDVDDMAKKGIDVSHLFALGPGAAKELGASEIKCPHHKGEMRRLEISMLDRSWEIDRATCCGGVFLDGGELNPFVGAARRALTLWADSEHASGRSTMDERTQFEVMMANTLIGLKQAVDAAVAADRARRRAALFDDDYDDDWDYDD